MQIHGFSIEKDHNAKFPSLFGAWLNYLKIDGTKRPLKWISTMWFPLTAVTNCENYMSIYLLSHICGILQLSHRMHFNMKCFHIQWLNLWIVIGNSHPHSSRYMRHNIRYLCLFSCTFLCQYTLTSELCTYKFTLTPKPITILFISLQIIMD